MLISGLNVTGGDIGLAVPILVVLSGAFVFIVKLMIQAALAQQPRPDDDAEGRADLKKQVQRSEDRIADLERDLDREREERAEDNRRHAREVADLNRQLQTVLRDLADARTRYSKSPYTEPEAS